MSVAATTRQASLARRASFDDLDAPGCCPAKLIVSSFVSFATRSRRKDPNRDGKSKRVASASLAQRSGSKTGELCVCDSINDQMIDRFTQLPSGIDEREWLAAHLIALFEHVNALCGCLSEICTPATCQSMSYPGTSKAYFTDEKGRRHPYPAMQYIDSVMSLCEKGSRNEEIFPTKFGSQFSDDFLPHVRRTLRLLWHCCGHIYQKHWDQLGILELRPQCALVIAHLAKLSKTFDLLGAKDQETIDSIVVKIRPFTDIHATTSESDSSAPQQRHNRVPSSKSGSWGGHPSPAVLSCKPFAQTC